MKHSIRKALALILVLACFGISMIGCQSDKKTIKIATKPMTEQFILAHMLTALIEQDTDITVELTEGIGGGTANIHPALLKGEFDLYPEYTGTAWSYVLKKEGIPDDETLFTELQAEYDAQYDLEWIGMYGFNNTFGLVVRKDIAEKNAIKTDSDLAPFTSELTFGAEYDFYEREDGYDALCKAYDYHFRDQVDLDIGLKYQSINSGEIDVMNVFTTDGQLSVSDVVLLEDDRDFYQTYYCGTVVRKDALTRFPELRDVLMKMDGILTDAEMAALNYEVEGEGKEPKAVAIAFLQEKGLLS
jgi:Periplasmic glycine betaine/choline-binding (lipo)protein of an ABC-type transport system (osmoprotectant binding protein)